MTHPCLPAGALIGPRLCRSPSSANQRPAHWEQPGCFCLTNQPDDSDPGNKPQPPSPNLNFTKRAFLPKLQSQSQNIFLYNHPTVRIPVCRSCCHASPGNYYLWVDLTGDGPHTGEGLLHQSIDELNSLSLSYPALSSCDAITITLLIMILIMMVLIQHRNTKLKKRYVDVLGIFPQGSPLT